MKRTYAALPLLWGLTGRVNKSAGVQVTAFPPGDVVPLERPRGGPQ
jgi:hypothetical protein